MFSKAVVELKNRLPDSVSKRVEAAHPIYYLISDAKVTDWRYFFKGKRVASTPYGPKIHYSGQNPIERAFSYGNYKPFIIDHFINNVAGESFLFSDVGANIGIYTLLFSQYSSGEVDAFEPVPFQLSKLLKNIDLNNLSNVNVYGVALGDTSDLVTIQIPEKTSEARVSSNHLPEGNVHEVSFLQTTLDEIYTDKSPPDLVHIDAEGAEVSILEGGKSILKNHSPSIYLVIHPDKIREYGDSLQQLRLILSRSGYEDVYDIRDDQHKKLGSAIGQSVEEVKYLYLARC